METQHRGTAVEEVRPAHDHRHEVEVIVDTHEHRVEAGAYIVAEFKKKVGVDAAKELEEIVGGRLVPLKDDQTIEIRGGEKFVSHVRTGGSS